MARTAACGSASPVKVMSARSVARLTAAPCTPGTAFSARSTRPTQDAQVMPSTGRLRRVCADRDGSAPGWRTTVAIERLLGMCVEAKVKDDHGGKVKACG